MEMNRMEEETNKKLVSLWQKAKQDFSEMDWRQKIKMAVVAAEGLNESFKISIFFSGSQNCVQKNNQIFCHWHGFGKECPDCLVAFTVPAWDLTERYPQFYDSHPDTDESREGMVWDNDNPGWYDRTELIDDIADDIADDIYTQEFDDAIFIIENHLDKEDE